MLENAIEEKLGAILAEKTWIGFDLDDTLHEFRRASSAAADAVLGAMHKRYGVPLIGLQARYREMLRAATANAFTDGKSSSQYRRERFLAVARHFDAPLEAEGAFLDELVGRYEATLEANLALKDGAEALLQALRRRGRKIAVVTEGPQDAQERTLEKLGIRPYVDFLATTNGFGLVKTEGLLRKVLAELGIDSRQMAYVGDSEDRDMRPAMRENIFAFHLVAQGECGLEAPQPRINSLRRLESILLSHPPQSPNRHDGPAVEPGPELSALAP